MVAVLLIGAVLLATSVSMVTASTTELNRSTVGIARSASYQAAEAGTEDYISKLTEDHSYYLHFVHPGEATRRDSSGALIGPGTTWNGGANWTYPNGRDAWRSMGNGYEYNLQISPPTVTNGAVKILSTGRKQGTTNAYRTVEVLV